jgi:dTDP-4-dehydrorhamnose 3,5-epimerase
MLEPEEGFIDGVSIKPLVRHTDERGYFLEVLRNDDELLERFGQSSYTLTYPGVIKAFHWHEKQYDLWFICRGEARVVLYDMREGSPTFHKVQQVFAGEREPQLIVIPPGVAHGYQVLGTEPVCLFYHTTESYDPGHPDEGRIPFDDPDIGFNWQAPSA